MFFVFFLEIYIDPKFYFGNPGKSRDNLDKQPQPTRQITTTEKLMRMQVITIFYNSF